MARIKVEDMEKRKRRIVRYIATRSHLSRPALISRRDMMLDLELTQGQLRGAMTRLVEQGYVKVKQHYLQSGVQGQNSYAVTADGRAYLESGDQLE